MFVNFHKSSIFGECFTYKRLVYCFIYVAWKNDYYLWFCLCKIFINLRWTRNCEMYFLDKEPNHCRNRNVFILYPSFVPCMLGLFVDINTTGSINWTERKSASHVEYWCCCIQTRTKWINGEIKFMARKVAWPLAFLCAYSELCSTRTQSKRIQITSTLTA